MKYVKFTLSLVLVIVVFYCLNSKFGSIPPIAKFLNPYTGVWQNETDESIEGEVKIDGFKEHVIVHYDKHLIPHIFAQNDADLYKAQGYITAKHRLWQMEFQTLASAGRLSEIFGAGALNFDRKQRRRGMGYGAEQSLEKMKADQEGLVFLKAYAAGVNAYIEQLQAKDLPVEYKLLDYKPEPWTIEKTGLLLMYMTKDLASREHDLEYTNALRLFGKERFDILFPDFYDEIDPIIPKATDWSFIDVEMTATPAFQLTTDSIAETIEKPHPDNGSNNWAVSGAKSYSGNPILANDPHLGLNLPSIWFVMQLSTPDYSALGATLPGALGVISGFNKHISWGETNATRDVLDWYKIEFKDADRLEYKYDGGWEKVKIRVEEIKIKDEETFIDSVRYTHHGPITYDKNFMDTEELSGYAMKWIGHESGNNQKTFLELNRARNYSDYTNALKHYVAPAQNFVFASADGDIALWIQGKFPNKWKGQGKFLMDGSNPDHDWQSYIPQEFNAHTFNPERGFVSSANQHPVDESYPFYVFNDGYETYRNRVINEVLGSKELFEIQDFMDLQNNNFNLKASELLPYMFKVMDTELLTIEEKEIFEAVKGWDFYSETNQTGPSIWAAWWSELYSLVWDEFELDNVALDKPFTYQTIHLLKTKGDDEFMDIQSTPEIETAKDLFLISFKKAVKKLQDWEVKNGTYSWKEYKATRVGHLLQGLPAFSRFDLDVGGGRNIVNATGKTHGASWRMIVEMSSPPKALGIYPGGQSGNPGSRYYDNFIDPWAKGDYHELRLMQAEEKADELIGTQILTPKK